MIFSAVVLTTMLFWPGTPVQAEEGLAVVRGTVQDPSGDPFPGATVTAKNPEAGLNRTTTSNAAGQFEISELSPGSYAVHASSRGLVSQIQRTLELGAGQSVTLHFVLQPGSEEQPSSASGGSGEAAGSSTATAANLVSQDQLVGLPLNGRRYTQLATLTAGVSDPSAASGSRGITGGNLNVVGARANSNNFLLDGTNIMDGGNQAPRSAAGVQLGSDAVLEVRVLTMPGAEYGRGSGGALNSITRSGSNEFHGTFFEYFRNSKMDARRFIDGPEPPPFKRNQFGFMLSGPVRKDKTFFLGSFEAMRDRLTENQVDFVPDESVRQGLIGPVHPRVAPYLALYPLPNSGQSRGGIGEHVSPVFLPTSENFFTIRVDHQISERNSLFARYTFDDASDLQNWNFARFPRKTNSRQQYLTLVGSRIFNPSVLNSFRFGYTRPSSAAQSLPLVEIPRSLFFVPEAPEFGEFRIPGLTTFGPVFFGSLYEVLNTFQFSDDFILQKGAHSLKLGAEIHRIRKDWASNPYKGGIWSFNSLQSFLQAGTEGTSVEVALPGSNNIRADRQTLAGFYLQDSYRLRSNIQINLGLRYEFSTLLHDKNGHNAFLRDPLRDPEMQVGSLVEKNGSLRNFAPRVGLSWSPGSQGDTQLSAGFGIYYDHLLPYAIHINRNTTPFYNIAYLPNFDSSRVFPDALAAVAGSPVRAQVLDYSHWANPTVFRYNFSIQQRLAGNWRVGASYVGARGNHLYRPFEANLAPIPILRADGSLYFPPHSSPNGPDNRRNPAFADVVVTTSDAQSFYNSLQLSLNKALSRGTSLQASYTYSKSVDDDSHHLITQNPLQYGWMRKLDRGLSDFDMRHRLTINYFYTPSLGKGQRWLNSGVLSYLFGGWRLGGIVQFRTGTPFSPLINVRTPGYLFAANRPNLLPGQSNNPIQGGSEQYFDPSVYSAPPPGTLGTTGKNTIIGPSLFSMDISLQREFLLDAKRRLQFRAEFFNLPNHTNLGRPQSILFTGSSARRVPTAGRIRSTTTTARQIQLALRFSF
ncbi:MAG: TonB-dependent receptor [Acidobacteria bacterium]|nr:TonB-dependent receptor [Acidobacteriota bacterium]